MRLVAISDTHMTHGDFHVPAGDVLVHTGDFTCAGTEREVAAFSNWFLTQPHRHKVIIAGNHDWLFQREPGFARSLLTAGVHYLQDSGVEIEGVKFWGAPWTPVFGRWAFMLPSFELREKWKKVPEDTDILLTHTPPYGVLDMPPASEPAGCADLLFRIGDVAPRYHIFGHIHNGYGTLQQGGTTFVNASICNEDYEPANMPVVLDIEAMKVLRRP